MDPITALFYIIATLVLLLWWFLKKKYSYWRDRGIPYVEPTIPFGNLKGVGKTINIKDFLCDIYNKYKGSAPFVGVYFFCAPVAIIVDSELIKNVLIRDFSYFQDRKMYYDEKNDPLSAHMFNLDGEKWKTVRQKLSPTFTVGRMRQMFPLITEVSDRFIEILDPIIGKSSEIAIQDLLDRFTIDVAGTVVYGIECNSLKDPNTEFRLKGKKVVGEARHGELVRIFMESLPEVARFFKMKLFHDDVIEFFLKITRDTIDYREKNNVHRNDFLDLLIQLKNTGSLEGDTEEIGKLSSEEIASQAFVFFIAGFETSSITIGFALYALALQQDIQDKVRKEICDVLTIYDGKVTYEAVLEMKYLHQVVNETLRVYSPVSNLVRKVGKDYAVPNTKFVLEKDTMVIIPVTAIHYDPEFYSNPEIFNPENFSPEAIGKRHSLNHLPFGDGPRSCIGLRFAKIQIYVALVSLLRNYRFKPSSKTPVPMDFKPDVLFLTAKSSVYFQLEKL